VGGAFYIVFLSSIFGYTAVPPQFEHTHTHTQREILLNAIMAHQNSRTAG